MKILRPEPKPKPRSKSEDTTEIENANRTENKKRTAILDCSYTIPRVIGKDWYNCTNCKTKDKRFSSSYGHSSLLNCLGFLDISSAKLIKTTKGSDFEQTGKVFGEFSEYAKKEL